MAIDMVRLNGVLNGRVNVTGVNGGSPSGAGALVVHTSSAETGTGDVLYTFDKTWKMIFDALYSGTPVVQIVAADNAQGGEQAWVHYITNAMYSGGTYNVHGATAENNSVFYSCASPDDYPMLISGGK